MPDDASAVVGIPTDADGRRIYKPDGEVLRQYMADRKHVSIIRGPIGSGTSSASCMKIFKLAMEQRPGPDGIRRTRWGVVRNTYPELVDTTLQTWLFWFPENLYGKVNRSRPIHQTIRLGDIELEIFFLALDGAEDISKLRSLEVTGWWFNEVEYTEKAVFDEAESRTGRFPSVAIGGPSWDGVIADMNAPTEDNWIPQMKGEVPLPDDLTEEDRAAWVWPDTWAYFVQPPALIEVFGLDGKTVVDYKDNPEAENARWLKPGFYDEKRKGKGKNWIDSRLMNRISVYADGKPVWQNFRLETHVSVTDFVAIPGYELIIGQDFGRRPATIICQLINNRFRVIEEFRGYDMGATTFAPLLKRHLTQKYAGFKFRIFGDPKGQDKTQADEQTAYQIFHKFGLMVEAAPVKGNNIAIRLEAVEQLLNEMHDGLPRFIMNPLKCRTLKVAMAGKYHYPKKPGGGHHEDPKKDQYSDICDALQYAALGAGEGRKLIGLDPAGARGRVNVSKKSGRLGSRKVN